MAASVVVGDCVEVMRGMPENSVDAIVCDPPYHLSFMGRSWDHVPTPKESQATHERWAAEALRVLKPGGHMLAFGGTRTHHRLACAVEDAGFEIRDSINWIYGSGFPKSLDVGKAIDKLNGQTTEQQHLLAAHIKKRRIAKGLTRSEVNAWFGYKDGCEHWERTDKSGARVPTFLDWRILSERLELSDEHLPLVERVEAEREVVGKGVSGKTAIWAEGGMGDYDLTAPATDEAKKWEGFGTALKPSHEPILVARKPLSESSVARNVLLHGTGALAIDACRVGTNVETWPASRSHASGRMALSGRTHGDAVTEGTGAAPPGRWPPNTVLSHAEGCVRVGEKRVDGTNAPGSKPRTGANVLYGDYKGTEETHGHYADPDGKETVAAWDCVEGCPVRALDEQSGQSKSIASLRKKAGSRNGNEAWATIAEPRVDVHGGHNDQGGASRFYPCFDWVVGESDSSPYNYSEWDATQTSGERGDTSPSGITAGTGSGASRESGESTPNLKAVGSGNGRTEKSPKGITSTTSTTTRQTTDSKTCDCSPAQSTTITTSASEKTTETSGELSTDAASGATNTSHSPNSTSDGQAPTTATAGHAPSSTPASGESATKSVCANCGGTTTTARSSATPNPRFFPNFEASPEPPFKYQAKASRAERNAGLEGMPVRRSGVMQDDNYKWTHDGKGNEINLDTKSTNHHPTVKPLALMRWLVRLVTPPGGTVLDPFAGSGSTLCAAVLEGFDAVGIELSEEYAEIVRRRLGYWSMSEWERILYRPRIPADPADEGEPPEPAPEPAQPSLFAGVL